MVNPTVFRQFVPLASLNPADRAELARASRDGTYQKGQVLFSRGDTAKTAVYLVSGEVELFDGASTTVVKAGTPQAQHPIAQGAKRACTATCLKTAEVLFVDSDRLDFLLTWSQTGGGGVEVQELEHEEQGADAGDWMTALLQSPAFFRIPPGNIAQIFAAMQPAEYKPGEPIIRQGEPGDFYYVIRSGNVAVMDESVKPTRVIVRLGVGKVFGEEALVSGAPRNATVRALDAVSTMRLSAADFARLLRAPMLREVAPEDVPSDAVLLDVRLPDEYRRGRLPDSVNLPLAKLREAAPDLDTKRCYVVYCDSGRRSASAAYLLTERGFDARVLAGGIPADEMPVRG
ncbi:MAG TPA: cyclic nucleotide-binding domain-containing protein [Xanthomonadales bacterium]|nr:cyclic nucleotide-binding domain-containing protein [Xanthomonadales bacterium]